MLRAPDPPTLPPVDSLPCRCRNFLPVGVNRIQPTLRARVNLVDGTFRCNLLVAWNVRTPKRRASCALIYSPRHWPARCC
jgi:hypothetical protein